MVAELRSDYRIDCEPCVNAIKRGKRWATSAARPLARVFGLVFAAIDDTPVEAFVWMPAHCTRADVGRARIGDGSLLTRIDFVANGKADELAKRAVEAHRVPVAVRQALKAAASRVRGLAMWLGRVTVLANGQASSQRDTEASSKRRRARKRGDTRARRGSASVSLKPRFLAILEPLRLRVAAREAAR